MIQPHTEMSPVNTYEQRRSIAALINAMPGLSPAELKVCLLILEQKSTRDIASELGVSERTVQNHRYSIRKKLGGKGNLMVELIRLRGE